MRISTCCQAKTSDQNYIDNYICPECFEECEFNYDEPDDDEIYNNFNHEGGIKFTKDEWQGR